jgi:hypothetical protein
MLPTNDGSEGEEKNVMRVACVVLMLLAFLSGCAARPAIRNQLSASVFPVDRNNGSHCAAANWNACR